MVAMKPIFLERSDKEGCSFVRYGNKKDGYFISVAIYYESVGTDVPFTEADRLALIEMLQSARQPDAQEAAS